MHWINLFAFSKHKKITKKDVNSCETQGQDQTRVNRYFAPYFIKNSWDKSTEQEKVVITQTE